MSYIFMAFPFEECCDDSRMYAVVIPLEGFERGFEMHQSMLKRTQALYKEKGLQPPERISFPAIVDVYYTVDYELTETLNFDEPIHRVEKLPSDLVEVPDLEVTLVIREGSLSYETFIISDTETARLRAEHLVHSFWDKEKT